MNFDEQPVLWKQFFYFFQNFIIVKAAVNVFLQDFLLVQQLAIGKLVQYLNKHLIQNKSEQFF